MLSEVAVAALPAALGDTARGRREQIEARVEAEAEARVQAERLRIARDLHDVVAHSLSTIAVQSGVAAHNLGTVAADDPVRLALERINATGKKSLEELRAMVGVLRSTDEAPLRPTPTDPDDFSAIEQAAEAAGIPLTVQVDGSFPHEVSEATLVAVHRIAEEALTNIARHAGSAPTTMTVDHTTDRVELRVINTAPAAGAGPQFTGSTGVGIVGMRERAESVGGTVEAGPTPEGGFQVEAHLPYRPHGMALPVQLHSVDRNRSDRR
jgi:signal transduction histidine kinase